MRHDTWLSSFVNRLRVNRVRYKYWIHQRTYWRERALHRLFPDAQYAQALMLAESRKRGAQ
jgi:hypothetical protein